MTYRNSFRRLTATAAVAMAMTMAAGVALAQPMGGSHGAGPGEEMIGRLIEHAKVQLNLNSSQQLMFDTAVADGKAARESARAIHQKVRDVMQAELAKPEPDLAAVAAAADSARDQVRTLHKPIRDEWLRLYATFTPEQKAVVRDMLKKRIVRADTIRQHMRERIQQRFGGANG